MWRQSRLVPGVVLASAAAQADVPVQSDARALLKAMSDYIAAQPSFSFTYNSTLEAVTKENQKLEFVSSGGVTVSRPDKIRATRTGGFAGHGTRL